MSLYGFIKHINAAKQVARIILLKDLDKVEIYENIGLKHTISLDNLYMKRFMHQQGFMTLVSEQPQNIFKVHLGGAHACDLLLLWACI